MRSLLALALVILPSSLCATEQWSIEPGDLREQVKTICIWPLEASFATEGWDAKRRTTERVLAHALERSGYRVVPATVTASALHAARGSAGSYDPIDGDRDHAKERAWYEAARATQELRCDADLTGRFVVQREDFYESARWDGADERAWPGQGGRSMLGNLPAISLEVALHRRAGGLLYRGAGGVQLAATLDVDGRLVDVAPSEWLARDDPRARGAVVALGGVIDTKLEGAELECVRNELRKALVEQRLPKEPTLHEVRAWRFKQAGREAHGRCLVAILPDEPAEPAAP